MFKTTRTLMSGLVWKQNAWGATRKRNAKDLRKRIESVEASLKIPYTQMQSSTSSAPKQTVSIDQVALDFKNILNVANKSATSKMVIDFEYLLAPKSFYDKVGFQTRNGTMDDLSYGEEERTVEEIHISVRRAVEDDKLAIRALISDESFLLSKSFGEFNVDSLIEDTLLSVVALDEENNAVGFVAFDCSPSRSSSVSSEDNKFEQFLQFNNINAKNSIWMTFFKAESIVNDLVRDQVFQTLFSTYPQIDYILYKPIRGGSINVFPLFDSDHTEKCFLKKESNGQVIFYCERELYSPKLKIRLGKVEDNDDLGPLFESSTNLTSVETEGEFFIADLLHNQNDRNKVLVAMMDEKIVGLMALSRADYDIHELMTGFNIGDYDDFFSEVSGEDYEVNSFEISIYFIKPEFEDRSIDFVRTAFEIFPKIPYCSLRLSFSNQNHPILEQFISIDPTDECRSSESLYVLPKAAFVSRPFVVEATQATELENILTTMRENEFSQQFISSVMLSYTPNQSITTMLMFDFNSKEEQEIIGICVLDHKVSELLLRRHYEIDNFIQYQSYMSKEKQRAMIQHMYIDPKHYKQVNTFMRELMRRLGKSILYYGIKPEETPDMVLNKELIRLKARRQIDAVWEQYGDPLEDENPNSRPSSRIGNIINEYESAYFINRRYLSEPKTEIQSRIVVIGASRTGLSFVRSLTMYHNLFFNNITLIAPDDFDQLPSFLSNTIKSEFEDHDLWNLTRMPNVRYIQDRLEDIDRQGKRAICSAEVVVPFDILLLATSRQYKIDKEFTEKESFPENGIINLNDNDSSIELLREYIEEFVDDSSCIMVYGSSLEAFGTVYAIIHELNVHPSRVLMIFPDGNEATFTDLTIISMIELLLQSTGIQFYSHYILQDFVKDEFGNLQRVYLMPTENDNRKKLLEVPCSLFINACMRDIDDDMLATINRESLVFDGRLIVDPNFQTTDPAIYAAGPITKFSRRFGTSLPVENYNSTEIGSLTAVALLKNMGITQPIEQKSSKIQLPQFRKKLSVRCPLPTGQYFFKLNTTEFVPAECQQFFTNTFGKTNSEKGQHYVSLYIHRLTGRLDCLCYYGDETIEQDNYSSLVGLPATYFNNLVDRHRDGLISDFIEYLRENWIYALYCDRFEQFREKLNKQLSASKEIENIAKLMIRGAYRSGVDLVDANHLQNLPSIVSTETKRYVEGELMQFLEKHQTLLNNIPLIYFLPET